MRSEFLPPSLKMSWPIVCVFPFFYTAPFTYWRHCNITMPSESDAHQSQMPQRQKTMYVIHTTRRRLIATDAKEYHRLVAADSTIELPGPFTDRDEILHQLRGLKEKEHREKICTLFARSFLYCKFPASQDSVEWDLDPRCYGLGHFIDCHNKSVAIYLFYPDIRELPGLVRD